MIGQTEVVAALALGLAGAGHCLGMCGGIAAAINLGGSGRLATTLAYHGGRLSSYAALGALLGYLAGSINLAYWTLALRYGAGLLLIAMGLSIAGWWQGISVLERAGAHLWRPVQKISAKLLPITHWHQGYLLGLGWGLMPCGLIYSALAWSATARGPVESGLLMLLFGIGTLPAMLATSLSAATVQAFLRKRALKILIALFLVVAGIWSLAVTHMHRGHLIQVVSPGASTMEHDHGDHHHH